MSKYKEKHMFEKLLEAYNDFLAREYDTEEETTEIPEGGILSVAYTDEYELDEGSYMLEVKLDVVNWKWLNYVNGELALEEPTDEETAIEDFLNGDFDGMLSSCVDKAWEIDQPE